MADLHLALKGEYFDAIKAGTKTEEYRMVCPFWAMRIEGREFQRVILTRGYPKRTDWSRRLELPWRGYTIKTITHPHFGNVPIKVYAIRVAANADTDKKEM
ncbi:ASCH domain-containing protein [Achromobacter ruhlandii]|uniref:ASCH domain-containing protein n=1 Tax=Achromobacter ruhlandii TaxID=72557 RepID=A0A848ND61_9BURK|nr:ASCH domain-containing protein [Achromobacter ruhlandii]NMU89047.1 ASCH domain-containing protein [Achromobacter ruhlandii]